MTQQCHPGCTPQSTEIRTSKGCLHPEMHRSSSDDSQDMENPDVLQLPDRGRQCHTCLCLTCLYRPRRPLASERDGAHRWEGRGWPAGRHTECKRSVTGDKGARSHTSVTFVAHGCGAPCHVLFHVRSRVCSASCRRNSSQHALQLLYFPLLLLGAWLHVGSSEFYDNSLEDCIFPR